MIIRKQAFARAGLVGNPSDGYFGKTISFIVRNFKAEVVLYETPELEILSNTRDQSSFASISALADDVSQFGYYGGIRLLKAAIKRFYDYCHDESITLDDRNFTLRYHTTIPNLVGLAGSSAIVTACLRALMAFYGVSIPRHIQPNIVLAVEAKELGIPAGLQDRVIQVYEGLVYMDFNRQVMERQGHGNYKELDPGLLPPLYIAYRTDLAEGTEVLHSDLRGRFNRGEPAVLEAMNFWANLADEVKECLLKHDWGRIPSLLNSNFDKRREICQLSSGNIRMVETARSSGASAKFCGSGGAIVGTYPDEASYRKLKEKLEAIGVIVFKPIILPEPEKTAL